MFLFREGVQRDRRRSLFACWKGKLACALGIGKRWLAALYFWVSVTSQAIAPQSRVLESSSLPLFGYSQSIVNEEIRVFVKRS
jgi:hypothetical protein